MARFVVEGDGLGVEELAYKFQKEKEVEEGRREGGVGKGKRRDAKGGEERRIDNRLEDRTLVDYSISTSSSSSQNWRSSVGVEKVYIIAIN